MSQTNWEADKMLDVYIHDYLVKRDLKATAQAFQAEGKVSSDPVAIDAPGGFLFEWWSVFWDIFIARNNEKHSEVAASYVESTQMLKAREQQHQQQQQPSPQQQLQQQQHIQMQQLLLQRHAQLQQQQQHHHHQQQQQQQQQQLQRRDGPHLIDGTANGLAGNDPNISQNSATANALATRMYEERLKLPVQRDCLDEAAVKQRFCESAGQMLDQSHASILKSAAASQSSGQVLHSTVGGMSPQIQARVQQHPVSTPEIKTDVNPMLNPRTSGPDGSLIGIPGSNQGGNSLTLKGWPLAGLDQLRPSLLQQQKSFMQASQPFHQLQMLTSQHQQQLLLAQQNLTSASANDLESRRLRMLLNNKMMALGKEGFANSVGDIVPNVGSPVQAACPALPRGDADMLIKLKMAQLQQQQQQSHQQLQQNALSCQQPQVPSYDLHSAEKMGPASSRTMDSSMPNSFRGNDQASKNQTGRKRKQPVSSSGPANSSGTANTAGPSTPSIHTPGDVMSLPSTPSNHTPGDMMSLPSLTHATASAKPILMFGSENAGNLAAASNRLADIEHFVEDGSLDDNGESFLSHNDADPRDAVACGSDLSKGFTFAEVNSVRASTGKVVCCHFSSDGKVLASGGHDKKVVLWYNDTLKPMATLEEHSSLITDVRFSPSMLRLATSSFDKSVRVWDADNVSQYDRIPQEPHPSYKR